MQILVCLLLSSVAAIAQTGKPSRWSEARPTPGTRKQPWLVGSNYTPATAINELEMWQADTFDPKTIDKELGWAEGLGMTTMRVFLHDLAWQQDAAGFRERIDRFLDIAAKHHIKPLFVLFDSCWDPNPAAGPAARADSLASTIPAGCRVPAPRRCRIRTQVSAARSLRQGRRRRVRQGSARARLGRLERARQHQRRAATAQQEPKNKVELVLALLPQVFAVGARGGRRAAADVRRLEGRLVVRRQAVADGADSARTVGRHLVPQLRQRRGIREADPVAAALPSADPLHRVHGARQRQHVRGIAARSRRSTTSRRSTGASSPGKTQTYLPWDSWQKPYVDREPAVWFHEIFKQDGTPYKQEEVDADPIADGVAVGIAGLSPPDHGRRGGAWWIVAAAGVLGMSLAFSPVVRRLDWRLDDRFVSLATYEASPPANIVIVAIDQASVEQLGTPLPWPRRVHAALVGALASAGARTIVFNLVFDEPASTAEDDGILREANRAGPGTSCSPLRPIPVSRISGRGPWRGQPPDRAGRHRPPLPHGGGRSTVACRSGVGADGRIRCVGRRAGPVQGTAREGHSNGPLLSGASAGTTATGLLPGEDRVRRPLARGRACRGRSSRRFSDSGRPDGWRRNPRECPRCRYARAVRGDPFDDAPAMALLLLATAAVSGWLFLRAGSIYFPAWC